MEVDRFLVANQNTESYLSLFKTHVSALFDFSEFVFYKNQNTKNTDWFVNKPLSNSIKTLGNGPFIFTVN